MKLDESSFSSTYSLRFLKIKIPPSLQKHPNNIENGNIYKLKIKHDVYFGHEYGKLFSLIIDSVVLFYGSKKNFFFLSKTLSKALKRQSRPGKSLPRVIFLKFHPATAS